MSDNHKTISPQKDSSINTSWYSYTNISKNEIPKLNTFLLDNVISLCRKITIDFQHKAITQKTTSILLNTVHLNDKYV